MSTSYNRMWKLLIDKRMSQADLQKASGVAPNTMTKLRKGKAVSLTVLDRICNVLNCDYSDIMEHIKEDISDV